MGLMEDKLAAGRLIVTPHPVLLDGQRNVPADLRPGESLYAFLQRHVEGLDGEEWHVAIGGREVPRHLWHLVRPKDGQVIELRGAVARSAVALVAIAALTYFTFGAGAIAGFSIGTSTALGTTIAQAAVFAAGSILINKVLAPKKPKQASQGETVFSLSAPRNRARPYEPLGLLLGSVRIAPDLASNPYAFYEGDDQYLSMVLTPGVNVASVDALYNGDALLSSFEGVQTWFNGFSAMPSQDIPLYSNADVVDGGTLLDTSTDPKHTPGAWVQRTSSASTIRLMVGVEFQLYDRTTKGGDKQNQEQIQIQYRLAGTTSWQAFGNYSVTGSTPKTRRVSYSLDVPLGQYEVRVRVAGLNTNGSGAQASFTWTTLTSVQQDTASYAGIPRIGIKMKATGQLNGAPDEIRCVAHSAPVPVWNGAAWVTQETSNPGAQILAYARGITDGAGRRIAGIGLPDQQIDIPALQAFMLHCSANGFTFDSWITDVRSHDDVLSSIALAGFGQITWAGGRLSVAWAADEQPLSGVVNMATIKKGQFQVDYTLANAADGIEYSYLDRETWEAKTLRVPAPGVETMLNPAQVTGEGVTSEAHAVMLARWHLAQSLYQYKAISYSTDIEHLSYRRLSMLALQHDLTQWGYGGRVMAATTAGGVVTLTLDEPVPAPPTGNAFIGLRIPGERVYRVMQVVPFTGTSRVLQLVGAWPSDAALPGNTPDNPAWDTLWIYDFKQTPGLRVRVTGIQPENDLKGASVSVVQEGPEFWHYVQTGEYIPPANQSLLRTRPVASNLRVVERQVVQGDTVFTELQASWEISGPVGETRVLCDTDGNVELEEVARTVTRAASWRIPRAGSYPITVRPYSPDGLAGVAVSTIYTTAGADAPPVLVDLFDVEELSGGVRRYSWGFFTDTIQSADFAGVEIRYTEGLQSNPVWDAMTALGADGYHAAAFEAVVPASGAWTFACRSRNTAGLLSTGMRVLAKTLGKNLGEIQQEQQGQIDENTQQIIDNFNQLVAEQQALLAELNAQAAELAQQAQDLANLQAAIDAPDWDAATAYTQGQLVKAGGHIYVARQDVPAGTPVTDTAFWSDIGEYATLAEAVGAISVSVNDLTNQVTVLDGQVDALATSVAGVASQLAGKADASTVQALTARVTAAENQITANSQAITSLQSMVAGKADASALNALATTVTNQGNSITAQGTAITNVQASLTGGANLLRNPSFEADTSSWSGATNNAGYWPNAITRDLAGSSWVPTGAHTVGVVSATGVIPTSAFFDITQLETPVTEGKRYCVSSYIAVHRGRMQLIAQFLDASSNVLGTINSPQSNHDNDGSTGGTNLANWERPFVFGVAPSGARKLAWYGRVTGGGVAAQTYGWMVRPMVEEVSSSQTVPSIWKDSSAGLATQASANAGAVSALQVTVTQQGNTIAAQGSAITAVNARVDGKADASAVQSLDTRVTVNEQGVLSYKASWVLTLDVNGYITGAQSVNNGTKGTFTIRADVFRLISPSGSGARTEFSDGNWRVYDGGGTLRVRLGVW